MGISLIINLAGQQKKKKKNTHEIGKQQMLLKNITPKRL